MSLDTTITGLWREVREAERANDLHTSAADSLRKRFVGPSMTMAQGTELSVLDRENAPSNFIYEYVTWVVAQLVYATPRVRFSSPELSAEDPLQDEVRLLGAAVNQWARSTDFLTFLDQSASDLLFAFGACTVSPVAAELGYAPTEQHKKWPEVRRTSWRNRFRDPLALMHEECRYWAERVVMDREDLAELARNAPESDGWDLEAIEALGETDVVGRYRPPEARQAFLERKEVELIEVYVPGLDLDDAPGGADEGYHGTLYTLACLRALEGGSMRADGESAVFARKPRAYYGPPGGCLLTCGVTRVPDSPWSLAPLVAMDTQAREYDAQMRAVLTRIRKRKRGLATTADDPGLGKWLESGPDNSVFTLRANPNNPLSQAVVPVEVNGASPDDLAALQLTGDNLRRVAGMGETQSGYAAGDATATEVERAVQSSSTRIDRIKSVWRRYVEWILYAVAWYIGTSKEIEVTIEAEVAAESGVPLPRSARAVVYQGGKLTPQTMNMLALDVDAISLERVSDATTQGRILQMHQLTMEALPAMAGLLDPDWWKEHGDMIGDALNVPHVGDHMAKAVRSFASQQQGMAVPQKPQSPSYRVNLGGPQQPSGRPPAQTAGRPQAALGGRATPAQPQNGGMKL